MGRDRKKLIRTSELRDPKKVFLLACEGRHTERRYFLGATNYIREQRLIDYLEIEIFEKSNPDISNPLNIFKELKEKITSLGLDAEEICLIVDRDADSFTESQYLEVIKGCNENGYLVYLSNPNFELWLLFHFVEQISSDEIIKFLSIKGSVEEKLQEILKDLKFSRANSFNKRIKFEHYKDRIRQAIKLAKNHEHGLTNLKDCLGTNVFQLIEKLFEV